MTSEQVGAALDSAGFSLFSVEMFLIAGLGWLADGAESAVLSYMLPSLMNHWDLATHELGYVGSLIAGGQALGSIFWGMLADVTGRRPAFLASVGLTAALGIISATAPSLGWYIALRFMTGFAIGGNLPLAIAVASELLPPTRRDRSLVALHLFYEVGALASTGFALFCMPQSCIAVNGTAADGVGAAAGDGHHHLLLDPSSNSSVPMAETPCFWRVYLFAMALPAAFIFPVALCRLPESPFWLAARGREAEATKVLSRAMRGRDFRPLELPNGPEVPRQPSTSTNDCADVPPNAEERATAADDDAPADSLSVGMRFRQLLCDRRLRCVTPFICLLWMFADMASGWWTWTPTFATMQHVDQTLIYVASMVGRVVASGSFIVATLIIDRVGARRLLLVTLCVTCGLSVLMTAWVKEPSLFGSPSFVVVYGAFSLFFGGAWPVMYVVTPASFDTDVRGVGFGLASAFGKLGTLLGPLIVGSALAPSIIKIGVYFTLMWAAAAVSLVCAWRSQTRRSASAPAI